jgi:hypothetical protein
MVQLSETELKRCKRYTDRTAHRDLEKLIERGRLKGDDFRGSSAIRSSSHSCTIEPCLLSHSSLRMAYRYSSPHFPLNQTFWRK